MVTDWTPKELRKDLENRVQCDLFYDVPKGFVDMLVKDRETVLALKEYYESGQDILNGSPRDIFASIHEIMGGGNIIPKWALEEWDDLNQKYGWTDKHTKIAEESNERFKSHTKDDEVDI